jgi:polyhydroxybutyrate depolymerase
MPDIQAPPGTETIALVHDGRQRPYLLHVPPAAAVPAQGWPLVLEIHGRGIDPGRFDWLTGFMASADEAGFAVAAPGAVNEIWNDGRDPQAAEHGAPDDVSYLCAVLDDVAGRIRTDSRRIYAAGMSNGASMAGRLACEASERFAAVAQVAGTAPLAMARVCHPARPVAILQIHGTADMYWPYEGGTGHGLRRRVLGGAMRPTVGVEDWARFWVAANGADETPVTGVVAEDTSARTWRSRSSGADVSFYSVEGAGHTWPGGRPLPSFIFGRTPQSFSATKVILGFFAEHSR